jgi:RimJ/RimL family protein N-acetyltransferase
MQSLWELPTFKPLQGAEVLLLPLDLERDTEALWTLSHGSLEKEAVWRFLPNGPFADSAAMKSWLQSEFFDKSGNLAWTVFKSATGRAVGTVSIISIVPEHGRAEIGHVWFSPTVHKTKINTETQFLLLQYLFDELGYRRVEWKCNAHNHASRTAAARMGFIFEGRFRQHMMVKGKNRDTDWFAMTDKDWPRCKANFQTWLVSDGTISLSELNSG